MFLLVEIKSVVSALVYISIYVSIDGPSFGEGSILYLASSGMSIKSNQGEET